MANDGPLIPIKYVLADMARDNMRAALETAARLCGELRPCRTCGAMLAVFHRKNVWVYYTVETGRTHDADCVEEAVQRLRVNSVEVQRAWSVLRENGMLWDGLCGD